MKEKCESKCSMACMCPWRMCMCHMKSVWMAMLMMAVLNFAFLWVVHAIVVHFAAGHAHVQMIFFAAAAVLGALMMGMHKKCGCCRCAKEE